MCLFLGLVNLTQLGLDSVFDKFGTGCDL